MTAAPNHDENVGVFFDGSMKRHHSIGGGQGEGQSPMIVLANRGTKSTSHQRHVVTARSANVLAGIDTNRSATALFPRIQRAKRIGEGAYAKNCFDCPSNVTQR